jgi:hypothetical protein
LVRAASRVAAAAAQCAIRREALGQPGA